MFKYSVSKIKNKKVQRVLNSDIGNYVVDEAQNKVRNRTHSFLIIMSKGISSFQIENAISNIGDDDLIFKFAGVFPSNI